MDIDWQDPLYLEDREPVSKSENGNLAQKALLYRRYKIFDLQSG